MTIALLSILGVLAYTVIAGLGYRIAEKRHRKTCGRCDEEINGNLWNAHEWPQFAWFMVGLFWPFVIPFNLGMNIGGSSRQNRAERKRSNEIAEAKHKAELAKIKRLEDAELDAQLAQIEKRYAS